MTSCFSTLLVLLGKGRHDSYLLPAENPTLQRRIPRIPKLGLIIHNK